MSKNYENTDLLADLPRRLQDAGWPWTTSTSIQLYQSLASWPRITIVTPSYNQGNYIEETIRSVLLQNYPNLQYVIIDGGSTDNTVDIIKKYQKWISYWVSEPDKGQSNAINKGLTLADGEIFNWLNSDDYYEPEALYHVALSFQNKSTHVVCGRGNVFDQQGVKYMTNGTDLYTGNLPKTIGWARTDQPETFFKKKIMDSIGPVPDLNYTMDRALWMKYLLEFGMDHVIKIPEALVNFRLHSRSKTVSGISSFIKERDVLFLQLAKLYNLKDKVKVLEITVDIILESRPEVFSQISDPIFMGKVLDYFLLLKANEFYNDNNKTYTNICLNEVDRNLLKEEDRKLYTRLKFRNKIPAWIIKKFRK